ncbi:MAG: CsgG/HfaB family protein [Cyanobacteria bacterium J06573_2]
MNYYFFRYVTFSILASLFAFNIGINKSVNAQEGQEKSNSSEADCSIPSRFTVEKLRIAVASFTVSGTATNSPTNVYTYRKEINRISDTIASRLAKEGNFTVVERTQISELYQNKQLCEIRNQFGIEALIIGSIDRFDLTKRTSGGGFLGFGKKTINTDADVELNVRIINTETGEIIDTFSEIGNTKSSDSSFKIPKMSVGLRNNNNYSNTITNQQSFNNGYNDVTDTNFSLTLTTTDTEEVSYSSTVNEGSLLTLATKKSISRIVSTLNANRDNLTSALRKSSYNNALVAGIIGEKFVVLNRGKFHGYKVGMKLVIKEVTRKIVDPKTKQVIRAFTLPIARVELIDVDNKSSIAKIISGNKYQIIFSEEIKKQIEKGHIIAKPIR